MQKIVPAFRQFGQGTIARARAYVQEVLEGLDWETNTTASEPGPNQICSLQNTSPYHPHPWWSGWTCVKV